MKARIVMLVLLMTPVLVYAQETFTGEHFIEVSGIAQQEIEPNEIYITIRLREFEENRQKTTLEKIDKDFLSALKEAGLDRKRLELASAGSKLDKLGKKEKDAFREKSYQLKLTSAAELEKFLEKLEPVKVDYVAITQLGHSDLEKIKMDLKVKALQAAKAKAETMLKAIGAEAGKPVMVREWDAPVYQPQNLQANIRLKNYESDSTEETESSFRKMKLQAQVTAQFQIK